MFTTLCLCGATLHTTGDIEDYNITAYMFIYMYSYTCCHVKHVERQKLHLVTWLCGDTGSTLTDSFWKWQRYNACKRKQWWPFKSSVVLNSVHEYYITVHWRSPKTQNDLKIRHRWLKFMHKFQTYSLLNAEILWTVIIYYSLLYVILCCLSCSMCLRV